MLAVYKSRNVYLFITYLTKGNCLPIKVASNESKKLFLVSYFADVVLISYCMQCVLTAVLGNPYTIVLRLTFRKKPV